MQIVLMIVVSVLVFGAVIFIHELGHFALAKWSKIRVNEFALGMGPTLLKKTVGETTYALRLLPIGGFVSMEGEDEESADARSFTGAPIYKRVLVTIAGAVMNVVLGFLALLLLVGASNGIVSKTVAELTTTDSPLQVGDEIIQVNGRACFIYDDLYYEFARTQNGSFDLVVRRDGEKVRLEGVEFEMVDAVDAETGEVIINESTGEPYRYMDMGFKVWLMPKTFTGVIGEAFNNTISYARLIYLSLFDLITGRMPINQLSGPVGIVSEIGKAVSMGWRSVVQLLALISVNLGVVNMLPLPALDGGRCLMLAVEAIRRKPIKQKYEIAINLAGFALLMVLMVVVSFNDIRRLAGF